MYKGSKLLLLVSKDFLTAQFILVKLAALGSLVIQAERSFRVRTTRLPDLGNASVGIVLGKKIRAHPRFSGEPVSFWL